MKETLKTQDVNRYTNMIVSFVNSAIAQTDGVSREYDVVKSRFGVHTMNTKNIRVYILDNEVTLDVFIGVLYGYSVPEVVCKLQETIIHLVQESTPLTVKEINVNVTNVMLS